MHSVTSILIATCLSFTSMLYCSEVELHKSDFNELLKQADEIKSSDFKRYTELVFDLVNVRESLTQLQQQELDFLLSYQLVYSGQKQEATTKLLSLIDSTSSDNIKFRSYGLLINSLVVSRKYSDVFKYFDDFQSLLKNISDEEIKSYGLGIMALVFNNINEFELGLYYANKRLEVATDPRNICIGLSYKAESLHRANRNREFDEIYHNAVSQCEIAEQPVYVGIVRGIWLEQLSEQDPKKALDELGKYLPEVESTSYNLLSVWYKALYSLNLLKTGQPKLALRRGLEAEKLLMSNEINYAVLKLYQVLYESSKAVGNFQNALTYHETWVEKQTAFEDEKTAGLLAYNITKANIEVKNQRIALLDKDNEVLSLQRDLYEQEAKQNRLVVLILAFVLVIATTLAYRGMTGRKRFKKIAEYDQLTGISNRYHFNNQARIALNYCENNTKPAAVILFDLDYFKTINDTHGHAAGDWALQAVVKTCRNFMRNNDVFGRIGGEEFAVVLPGCHTDKAVLLAEICRDAIGAIDSSDSGKQFPLSASFGVSGSDTSGYQLKQLLADADYAMYRAKELGRDTVAAFSDYRSTV
ncbi:GGDEF domain-containing protein [Rheinheimera gaetbuli]